MKILMGLDYYLPHTSGLTLYAAALAEALVRRGHQVSVLTHRHAPELPATSEVHGVRVERAAVAGRVGKALISPAFLARALSSVGGCDVFHLHSPLVGAVPLSLLAATKHVPLVVTYHCDLQPSPLPAQRLLAVLNRASQDFALDRAARIVTNTEDYARHTPSLSERADKVTPILPLVADPRTPTRPPDAVRRHFGIGDGPVVFFLGRFTEEKGLPVLLSAFPEIRRRHPGAHLVLAGAQRVAGETVWERVAPLAADPASGVVSTGVISEESVDELFSIADVLVLPSINATESFGMVQVEAMLAGVPVVASDLPGVRQPVAMTGMGRVARPGDPDDLASRIVEVFEARARFVRPRAQVRALFSAERTLSEYEAVYRSAASSAA
jgi:glycosyltransferase involved in cell wall biosynthesis